MFYVFITPVGPWRLSKRAATAASDDAGNVLLGDLGVEELNLIPSDK